MWLTILRWYRPSLLLFKFVVFLLTRSFCPSHPLSSSSHPWVFTTGFSCSLAQQSCGVFCSSTCIIKGGRTQWKSTQLVNGDPCNVVGSFWAFTALVLMQLSKCWTPTLHRRWAFLLYISWVLVWLGSRRRTADVYGTCAYLRDAKENAMRISLSRFPR